MPHRDWFILGMKGFFSMSDFHKTVFLSVVFLFSSLYLVSHGVGAPSRPSGLPLYVSPEGNDAWSGKFSEPNAEKTDGPLATLQAAVDQARQLAKPFQDIRIETGEYFLEKPLELDARDPNLSIQASNGARPVLIGGRVFQDWQKDDDRFWSVSVPEAAQGTWDFRMLVVYDEMRPGARIPEPGTFVNTTVFDGPGMRTTGGGWKRPPTPEELTTLTYKPGDLPADLDFKNAEITVYHMWDESTVGLKSHDPQTHTLKFSSPAGHPAEAFGVRKYSIANVREGMKKPGQWYLDRTRGRVVYWPLEGEDMTRSRVLAPTLDSLIRIQGTPEKPVSGVLLRGLTLSLANTPLRSGGFGAYGFPGAIQIEHAQSVELKDLRILNVAGQGIKADSVQNLKIAHSEVGPVGACGLKLDGVGIEVKKVQVHHPGRLYPSAIALHAGGENVVIAHNEIHHTPYTAINSGGKNIQIERNRIHHAMEELHDGAGIYVFGGKNTVLKGNFIHDITDLGGYGASAYYLDETCENCVVEENLALRVGWPFHCHMAQNNTIRQNVFVSDGDMKITFPRSKDNVFEQNILSSQGKITFTNLPAQKGFRNNVLFSVRGKVVSEVLQDYSTSEKKRVEATDGNVFADPMLRGVEEGDVQFDSQSPAADKGIQPLDVRNAGRSK
jgi:hypothetical protein